LRGDVVAGSLVAVHAQHIEAGWYEPLGRLPIKVHFGVAAVRSELESVMWTAVCESLRGDLRVSVEDHGEFGPVGFGVELPQKSGVYAVEALHHQGGGDVAVGNNSGGVFDVRPYRNVVIPIGGVEARQSVAGDGFDQLLAEPSDGAV
jgi:hypothetical protein